MYSLYIEIGPFPLFRLAFFVGQAVRTATLRHPASLRTGQHFLCWRSQACCSPLYSSGTGESDARTRLAFRTLGPGTAESVATSCGKVQRWREESLIPIA
jgi:hypothetical protein